MPSPYPGMDPYLEDPFRWPGFHSLLAGEIMAALNRQLVPDYYANVEERVYISDETDIGRKTIIPDVRIIPTGRKTRTRSEQTSNAAGTLVCEPVEVTTMFDEEIHESFVKVIERNSRQVVTVIEILSPTNKVEGSRGRDQYEQKRNEVLNSDTHWVEIDLLRQGEPLLVRELYPECEYTVHVSRAGRRPRGTVWPIRLVESLPAVLIPLKVGDPDASLDLQPLMNSIYDRGAYGYQIDYRKTPVPPLPAELEKWSNKLLKQKKLR